MLDMRRGTLLTIGRLFGHDDNIAVRARTLRLVSLSDRDAPEHHEVLLPEGAAGRFRDSGVLWNASEAADRREDAQVAREVVFALPANAGIAPRTGSPSNAAGCSPSCIFKDVRQAHSGRLSSVCLRRRELSRPLRHLCCGIDPFP